MEQPNKQSVQDTLREVIGETVSSPKETSTNETKDTTPTGTSAETKSGEPAKEYVSGIDLSDIPEQDRPRIKELLSKKAKLLEDGYTPKFQKVAHLAKAEEDIKKLGLTAEEIQAHLIEYANSKKGIKAEAEKSKNLRTLDRLIEKASDEDQKAALIQMRTIVEEETGIKAINERLDRFEKFYQASTVENVNKRQAQLDAEIKSLESQYGSEIVGKYKEDILKHGLSTNNTARRLLHAIAEPEEIEQAILLNKTKPTNRISEEKLNAISSNSSGINGSKEHIDTKKVDFKGLFRELVKK